MPAFFQADMVNPTQGKEDKRDGYQTVPYFLQNIEQYAEKVHKTADYNENMEHRVHVTHFLADAVQNSTDGVAYTAEHQECQSAGSEFLIDDSGNSDYTPADSNVQYHSQNLEAVQVNCRKYHSERCQTPHYAEINPAEGDVVMSE